MGVNLKRIKAYRVYNDLNQYQMADALGIAKTSYYLKETGERDFTSEEVGKMAEIFGVEPGDLFSKSKQLA